MSIHNRFASEHALEALNSGAETMVGGPGDDTFFVDDPGDQVIELSNGGTDIVFASVSHALSRYVENLTLTGSAALSATGNTLGNILTGNSGNNILNGKTGADTMYGGAGDDHYYVDNAGDVVSEQMVSGVDDGGIDTVSSSVSFVLGAYIEKLSLFGSDNVNGTGNALHNSLGGSTGNNVLWGLGGNDVLNGREGADTAYGGSGNDAYYVDSSADVVSEQTVVGVDDGGMDQVYATASFVLGDFVESLTLTGTADIDGTGNDRANTLLGNSGNNVLYGMGGEDVLNGGTGADTMYGGEDSDVYYVDNSADVVTERVAAGVFDGGNDLVRASASFVLGISIERLALTGTANIDGTGNSLGNSMTGNAGNNVLRGMGGNDAIQGLDGNDTIYGGDGHDGLVGNSGADDLYGGAGNDTYRVDNAGDRVFEDAGQGVDMVYSQVSYAIADNIEYLVGDGVSLNLTGNGSNNIITGWQGSNVLDGGAGNDTLSSGHDADTLIGGSGVDTFQFATGDGSDTVMDFLFGGEADTIDVHGCTWGTAHPEDISQVGSDTQITLPGGVVVLVLNASVADVSAHMAW